jgi:hypothetical protein
MFAASTKSFAPAFVTVLEFAICIALHTITGEGLFSELPSPFSVFNSICIAGEHASSFGLCSIQLTLFGGSLWGVKTTHGICLHGVERGVVFLAFEVVFDSVLWHFLFISFAYIDC